MTIDGGEADGTGTDKVAVDVLLPRHYFKLLEEKRRKQSKEKKAGNGFQPVLK